MTADQIQLLADAKQVSKMIDALNDPAGLASRVYTNNASSAVLSLKSYLTDITTALGNSMLTSAAS